MLGITLSKSEGDPQIRTAFLRAPYIPIILRVYNKEKEEIGKWAIAEEQMMHRVRPRGFRL